MQGHRWDHHFWPNSWPKRNLPGTPWAQEPWSSWGQDPSDFHLGPRDKPLPQVSTPKSTLRELVPQECWHTLDHHRLIGSQRDKPQSEVARPANTRDNQMVRGKHNNLSNRNQGYLALSEPNSPTTASPTYRNTLEKQESDLKITSHDDDREL